MQSHPRLGFVGNARAKVRKIIESHNKSYKNLYIIQIEMGNHFLFWYKFCQTPNKHEGVVYIFYSSSPFTSIPIINIEVRFGNKKGRRTVGGLSPFFSLYYSIENIYCFTKNLFLKKNYLERCKKDVRKFVNTFNLRYLCKQ